MIASKQAMIRDIGESREDTYSMKENTIEEFWEVFDEHERKFGNVSTPEIDWREDVESKDFD